MPQPEPEDFAEKLVAARLGDRVALGELLEQTRPELVRLAVQGIGTQLQPRVSYQDVVQDVLTNAIEGFTAFEGESEGEFRAWLLTILTNHLVTLVRHHLLARKRSMNLEQQIGEAVIAGAVQSGWIITNSTPSRQAMRSEQDMQLQSSLADLPQISRETIRLRDYENMSFQQIAAIQGCTVKAAEKRYARAIVRLGRRLRESS